MTSKMSGKRLCVNVYHLNLCSIRDCYGISSSVVMGTTSIDLLLLSISYSPAELAANLLPVH